MIDRRTFWTDLASGLVLAALVPLLPFVLLIVVLAATVLFVLDAATGGSALDQVADKLAGLIQAIMGGQ